MSQGPNIRRVVLSLRKREIIAVTQENLLQILGYPGSKRDFHRH